MPKAKAKYGEEPRSYVPSITYRKPKPTPTPPTPTEIGTPPPPPPTHLPPEDTPPDPTPTHLDPLNPSTLTYLSTLPIHLRPTSPYLAALHDARIRLLSIQLRSPIRWCINCGSLRDTSLASSSSSTGAGSPKSKSKGGKSPKKSPAAPACATCGEKFRRARVGAKAQANAEVLASFRPARAVRKSRRDAAAGPVMTDPVVDISMPQTAGEPAEALVSGIGTDEVVPQSTSASAEEDDPMTGLPSPNPPIPPAAPKLPATPLAAPNLRYIPSTAPTPPTYDQAAPVRPPAATASIGGKTTPISSGGKVEEGAKRKKKKASGLAKLLAQSREREEGDMGGKWGFG